MAYLIIFFFDYLSINVFKRKIKGNLFAIFGGRKNNSYDTIDCTDLL